MMGLASVALTNCCLNGGRPRFFGWSFAGTGGNLSVVVVVSRDARRSERRFVGGSAAGLAVDRCAAFALFMVLHGGAAIRMGGAEGGRCKIKGISSVRAL